MYVFCPPFLADARLARMVGGRWHQRWVGVGLYCIPGIGTRMVTLISGIVWQRARWLDLVALVVAFWLTR